MAISACEQPLSKVFTADYQFEIPSFQRAYQWHREQMLQLLDDIMDASHSNTESYFLGSLILVRDQGAVVQVIDGQQRLISLSIIFAVLRELEEDNDLSASLDGLLVESGDKLRGIAAQPRLRLRERDEEFFQTYVQQGDLEALFDLRESDCITQAQRNIYDNTRCVYDALANLHDEERQQFASFLVNDVMLVIVTTDDLSGAHRIFDVMNMRGIPLTASDVFKSKVISQISPAARDAYASYWDDIMEPMGDNTASIEEFFEDLYLIKTRKPLCEQLLADFSDHVLSKYFAADAAIDFVDDMLRPYATAWQILEHPGDSILPSEAIDLLIALRDYPTRDWKPVAMWILVHTLGQLQDPDVQVFANSAKENANTAQIRDGVKLCEVLRALERVTGIDSLNMESQLHRRVRACTVIRDLRKGLAVQRMSGFIVSKEQQRSAMMHLRGELTISDHMKRLLLVRANEQLSGGRITRPRSLNAIRLVPEHVQANSSFASWPAEQVDYWVDRIGNFVLTQASEKSMSNLSDFADRRSRILQSSSSRLFPLTHEIGELADITPQTLVARHNETVRLIAQSWSIQYLESAEDGSEQADVLRVRSGGAHRARPTSKRVTIAQVVDAGLLTPGETLVWERPRKHERWCIVVDKHCFRSADGRTFASPTAAAKAFGGGNTGGLNVWKRESTGQSLADVWKTYRKNH